jgi:hypothetical protein
MLYTCVLLACFTRRIENDTGLFDGMRLWLRRANESIVIGELAGWSVTRIPQRKRFGSRSQNLDFH